jgi:hypothetical protein
MTKADSIGFSDARAKWNERYCGSAEPLFGTRPNLWLTMHAARFKTGMSVLCVGEGEARNAIWLAKAGCKITAFDISDVARERALQQAERDGVTFDYRLSDLTEWDWRPNAFAAVTAIFVQFASPKQRDAMFEGIRCSLVPSGFLVIEGYGMRQLDYKTGGPGKADHLYGPDLLRDAFPGWTWLARRDADVMLAEGTGHVGKSHVISAVLQKPGIAGADLRSLY